MKIKFYNNWRDYIKGTVEYKGYFAFIPLAFYAIAPQYILVIANFSIILDLEKE